LRAVTNTFYSDFDLEPLHARTQRDNDQRNNFQIDRDRIIFSAAFRSLQSKTQVFHAGEYDFYRTRLTHSLEVAQIGRGICQHLAHRGEPLCEDFFIDPDLVEAICLAHDIGHPPYGHAGESALNEVLADAGGFEGNAQTLRILTDLLFGADGGMKPTRALLDGVLKYKRLYANAADTPSKFLYADQKPVLDFVFSIPNWPDERRRAPRPFRSIECQIMDWADDIAYGLMDIVDGVNARFITLDSLEKWRAQRTLLHPETEFFDALKKNILDEKIDRTFAMLIGDCIQCTALAPRENFMSKRTNRYAFDLAVAEPLRVRIEFYKRLADDLIFRTPQIKQLEYKGRRIITELFRALRENYRAKKPVSLVPKRIETQITRHPESTERLLGDYLSGLTDATCVHIYRRLFDPSFGSITDLHS
jgi:dGTPase